MNTETFVGAKSLQVPKRYHWKSHWMTVLPWNALSQTFRGPEDSVVQKLFAELAVPTSPVENTGEETDPTGSMKDTCPIVSSSIEKG